MPLIIGNGGVNDLVFRSHQEKAGVCRYRVTPAQTQFNSEHEDVRYMKFRYWTAATGDPVGIVSSSMLYQERSRLPLQLDWTRRCRCGPLYRSRTARGLSP